MGNGTQAHWERVYVEKNDTEVSWHQEKPVPSLDLAKLAGINASSEVIDVGGGTSRFVDGLLAQGVENLTVLDISEHALAAARARLGPHSNNVSWIAADVTTWSPDRQYDLWHDRAVFHFLTGAADRAAYVDRLYAALRPNGHAIIATFALDGPERCSGLPVVRYSPETLAGTLGNRFQLVAESSHLHVTPWNSQQSFQFSLFRKI
ncbi:class I SAM-dependent methyltransferase [Palleronia sp.]|uniref:class I SAM-dependent methyltransferase n=1 Tax=Palleronia sp. TaxID=1940284 RepID=UPI0035C7B2A6